MQLIPTDTITCTLGSARTVDVHVDYHDNGDPGQRGSKNTAITTTAAATIVAAPPNQRDVDHISICNTDAASTTVEVKHVRSGTGARLTKVTLSAGAELHWTPGHGWDTSTPSTLGVPFLVTITSSVNSSATHDTYVDITGLSFAVTSGLTYRYRFHIPYTSAATTTGAAFAINGPASPTALNGRGQWTKDATTCTFSNVTAYDIPASAAGAASSLTVGNVAILEGTITPSADGTVIGRVISEVDSSLITVLAGATVEYMRIA